MARMPEDPKAKNIRARVLLSSAVMDGAPDYVISALTEWIRSMSSSEAHQETVGVGDHADVSLVNVRRKSDA